MMPAMPPLNLSIAASSKSGDVNASNTVHFGGFGGSTAGGGGLMQWLPWLAVGGLALVLIRRK
mgnify:CR=1 FL=1